MMEHFLMYPYNWVLLVIAVILLALAIIFLVRYFGRQEGGGGPEKSPLDIANERYARGEISHEEYERIKRELTE